jgi:uncharacterized membrane protein YjjP (DUF1212 family)
MSEPANTDPASVDHAAMEFVTELGASMIQAGTAVSDVQESLLLVSEGLGLADPDVLVLPTAVLMQVGNGARARSRMSSFHRSGLRLDQISTLDELTRHAEYGQVEAADGLQRLRAIAKTPPPMPVWVRIIGMGVLSTGFALVLQPTRIGLLVAFVLGLAIGVLRVLELAQLQIALPVLATFGVSIVVFEVVAHYGGENPVRMLIPPLVLFLPGAALTTGTMELAAGDTVSGASRLVEGVVNLLLLAFGIVAAAQVVHLPTNELLDHPIERLGWVTPLIGLVVITLGHYLHNCAPRRWIGWIFVVSCVAFAAQAIGARAVSAELSGFFGAVAMTPLIIWLSDRPDGPPKMTLFLPAFWLLVPGATGLIGITQAVGTHGVGDFSETAVTVASIALGTLIGAAFWNASHDVASYTRRRIRDVLADRE